MTEEDGKRVNIGVRLLPATVAALDAAGEAMGGRSRAFVIEVLAALHAGKLGPATAVPVGMMPQGSRAKKGTGRAPKPKPAEPPAQEAKPARGKRARSSSEGAAPHAD